MYKLIYGVAKRKDNRLLSMDDRPTEFCLDAIVLGDEWIVERLFDENGSHLTVCH